MNSVVQEFLTQHFGFPTDYFIDSLSAEFYTHMYTAMAELQEYLDKELASTGGEYTVTELEKVTS